MRELDSIETIAARVRIAKHPVVLMGYLSPGDQFEIRSVPASPNDGVRAFTFEYAQAEFDAMEKMGAKETVDNVTAVGDDTLILECSMVGNRGGGDFSFQWVMVVTIRENKVLRMVYVRLGESAAQDELRSLMPTAGA
jgi:hypothetical protein